MGPGRIFLHFFILPVIKMGPGPIFWQKIGKLAGFVPK
jgi:hypothetical protein